MPPDTPLHLIARFLSNEASEKEQDQLFEWISHDQENQRIFNDYQKKWSYPYPRLIQVDVEAAMSRMARRIDENAPPARRHMARVPLKIAASIILLMGVVTIVLLTFSKETEPPLVWHRHVNPPGKRTAFSLPDGTEVTLNAGSALRFPEHFNDTERVVALEGEAFFRVVSDSLHPFVVEAGEMSTRVLGTSFNINCFDHQNPNVTVEEGLVQVSYKTQKIRVERSQKAVVTNDDFLRVETANLADELSWKENTLRFSNIRLDSAFAEIGRWYGVTFTVDHEEARKRRITATYHNESLDVVLQSMSFSLGMKYRVQAKTITIDEFDQL